jgi:hypothetical protein
MKFDGVSTRSLARRPRVRVLFALVTVLLGLASQSTASAQNTHRDDTTPVAGQCHQITMSQLGQGSDTSEVVPCTDKHNMEALAVVDTGQDLTTLSDTQKAKLGLESCSKPWIDALGGKWQRQMLTAYSMVWFYPSDDDESAGAEWVQCDVILLAGTKIAELSKGHVGHLPSKVPNKIRQCVSHAGGNYYLTACVNKHLYRATGTFQMTGSHAPASKRANHLANTHCPQITKTAKWAFFYNPQAWDYGNHYMVCSAKSKS